MQVFFTAVIGFLTGLLQWMIKKFGISKMVLAVQIAVVGLYTTFILTAVVFFLNFLFSIWNLLKQLVNDFSSLGLSASGVSYTVSNSQIVSSMWAFIHASGLDDALITAFGLFISIVSTAFAIQAYKIVRFAYKELYTMLSDLIRNTLI